MTKIFIDRKLLDFQNPLSANLISTLKKLSQNEFELFCSKGYDEYVAAALENEAVVTLDPDENSGADFIIEQSENKIRLRGNMPDEYTKNLEEAVQFLIKNRRTAEVNRRTKETQISVELNLDGTGGAEISTGVGFFDHMLEQIARHGNIDLKIEVAGDLHVDEHHTVEDTGIALGEAILSALGDKKGITRYGFFLPMDETIAKCALDFGGRQFLNFKCKFSRERVGDFPTELTEEFFRGLASGMKANLYLRAKGKNDHHKIEAMFKAFAKSLNDACRPDERAGLSLPSTKGIL